MSRRLARSLEGSIDGLFKSDWERQRRTAEDILGRLGTQEGVILADQVGMGKTYVALAVAATTVLREPERRQVMVFVPPRVAEKWVNEWGKFSERLLNGKREIRCVDQPIRRAEDLLKALDDGPAVRSHLLIVTHTALTASLQDGFIQLALAYYAARGRHGVREARALLAKWAAGSSGLFREPRFTEDRVLALLETHPKGWRDRWRRLTNEILKDDPVPDQLEEACRRVDLDAVWDVLVGLPRRRSSNMAARLKNARKRLNDANQAVWREILTVADLHLPLLIVDEAHALKNNHTRISRLFTQATSDEPENGALVDVFERILLLTATPFELGHDELTNVLSRLDAVRDDTSPPVKSLDDRLDALRKALAAARESALRLDGSWGRISAVEARAFDRWVEGSEPPPESSVAVRRAWNDATYATRSRREMHGALRSWVIRHERPNRRSYKPGIEIRHDVPAGLSRGLPIDDDSALPFLLASRAQAIASEEPGGASRPLFAYGIASSYEAYLRLETGEKALDSDEAPSDKIAPADRADPVGSGARSWYHREIQRLLNTEQRRDQHPKILATVDRATELWRRGEKCLIFCWYIRTTKALELALSRRVDGMVREEAVRALGTSPDDAIDELRHLGRRLLVSESSSHDEIKRGLIADFMRVLDGEEIAAQLATAAIRNLRTPSALVRFTRLHANLSKDDLIAGISGDNPAGVDLLARWRGFAERMAAMTIDERDRLLVRLLGDTDHDSDASGRGASLQPVRRAYGGTRREDRERLISVFNTPFLPDILVASSVMGEGIDLHQECRNVIHHDLDWNPSNLEQRTGRLDRIGSLAEREDVLIDVYEPYLAGTHDEKMYRVVKDRAGWFDIVMGRAVGVDESSTDEEERRVPLHKNITDALSMNLES